MLKKHKFCGFLLCSQVNLAAGIMLMASTQAADTSRKISVNRKILSSCGSTRATAYSNGNKIVTKDGKIFVAWLDHVNKVNQIKVKCYDNKSKKWSDSVIVGTGKDSHVGPVLAIDKAGYLHMIYGAHHQPFKYTRTVRPLDISKWTREEYFGSKDTYPSLVTAPDGTLWCASRSSKTDPWRLCIYHRSPGRKWSSGTDFLAVNDKGYAQVGNSLAVDADGTIHVGILVLTQKSNGGRYVGYLRSRDAGKTWQNAAGHTMKIPVTVNSDCFINKGVKLDMRIGNIAVDPDGTPWLSISHLEKRPVTVMLRYYENNKWNSINLLPFLRAAMPGRNIAEATIAFDKNGTLYVAGSGGTGDGWWGSPLQEVFMMKSKDKGKSFEVTPISKFDSTKPSWLPSIERPVSAQLLDKTPSVLFTRGIPGKGVKSKVNTDVIFAFFDK